MTEILGVKVDNFSKQEILSKVDDFLSAENFHQIATVNAEFILRAGEDKEFKNILNSCDLNVADSITIWYAFIRYGKYLKSRMAGIDLMLEILKIANEKKMKIFLAAKSGGLSSWEETRDAILKIYPNLEIDGDNIDVKNLSYKLKAESYQLIFCSFGAPEQEKFLNSLKSQNGGKIRLAMGVGGSFDYLTGKVQRAPKFMRKLGFEWLWRLIQQPKRWKRIWNAVIVFPIRVIFNK